MNINLHEIANFRKYAKIYTRENIYVHSNTATDIESKAPCTDRDIYQVLSTK